VVVVVMVMVMEDLTFLLCFFCVSFVFPFVFLLLFGVSVVDVQWCSHDGQWKKENDLH
jgi:hypothetical protein